jgi:hypothetical protein
MALAFAAASTQKAEITTALLDTLPGTMACWFRVANAAVSQTLLQVVNNGAPDNYHALAIDGGSSAVAAASKDGGSFFGVSTRGTVVANTWSHAAGVWTSGASRTAYLDGVAGTTDTTSGSPSGVDRTNIAGNNPTYTWLDGDLAEVAVWSVALTARELAALAKGFTPPQIRPSALIAYWPLSRDDRAGGLALDRWRDRQNLTESGGPTLIDHPRIYDAD